MKTLIDLLQEADELFPPKKTEIDQHSFELARVMRGLWSFNVIDSWHKWSDKDLKTDFGLYQRPEFAVQAFLDYVKKGKINVEKLMEKQ